MSDISETCLDTFPQWLGSLGDDVSAIMAAVQGEGLHPGAKAQLVAGINYLFKSMDLIPDGIKEIGYLDDAFVLRVSARLVEPDQAEGLSGDHGAALVALAGQCELIQSFLGDGVYGRLERYVQDQRRSSIRGRIAEAMADERETWQSFAAEVQAFVEGYEPPEFHREERNLAKLKAFFEAKLPR